MKRLAVEFAMTLTMSLLGGALVLVHGRRATRAETPVAP